MRIINVFFLLICFVNIVIAKKPISNLQYVDPTIGSAGVVLEPAPTTIHLPNSMIRVFPIRRDQLDNQTHNFPLTQASYRFARVFAFLPVNGLVNSSIWDKKLEYRSETIKPYYYNTTFEYSENKLEFTPQARSGIFRIQFCNSENHFLRFGIFNSEGNFNVTSKNEISGTEDFNDMKAYFYAQTDCDITEVQYKNKTNKQHVLVGFGNQPRTVQFRYGISFISVEQAKQNLSNEITTWNFESFKAYAKSVWVNKLSQINVSGGTEVQKRVFYTSLYRCYERMIDINEYGKYYSGYDHKVHNSDQPFFVDNWMWDTHIALEPLHMILNPAMEQQKICSYVEMYKQCGSMPSFAMIFGDFPAMTGNFAAVWMADAWFKGLRNFDLTTAYEGLRKNSLDETLIPWRNGPKTEIDDFFNLHGYMPGLRKGEKETVATVDTVWEKRQCVSVTTANSYSDWCIARLAAELKNTDDQQLFLKRAANYKNVFRADKGFMWPKDKDGNWIEPFDPRFAGREYFTENNAYTYNWDVKHDLEGLIELMGGRVMAEEKLDQLFREELGLPKWKFWYTQPDATGLVGQFVMGNEPSFHIPYIYNYTGSPWKTQKRIRMLLETYFPDTVFGYPGDEDGGGMTSFVVFSMLGFFQVTPGLPVYSIGSPIFDKATIKLSNGNTFSVITKGNSKENIYIQNAKLNGQVLEKSWFTHEQLKAGGVLEFEMGSKPNKLWGSNLNDLPPSKIDYK